MKHLFTMLRVPGGLRRLHLYAANVRDDLPNLLRGHAYALLRRAVRRHRCPRHALANRAKQFRVGIAMLFLRSRQIRTPSATPRSQPVAKSAIRAKLKLSLLRRFGI